MLIQQHVLAGPQPGTGGVSEKIQLGNQPDAQFIPQLDQAAEFGFFHGVFLPAEFGMPVKFQNAPAFNNCIVEFVIRRKTDLPFDFPHRCFREPAQMNAPESGCRVIFYGYAGELFPERGQHSTLGFGQLPDGVQGIPQALKRIRRNGTAIL